MPTYIYRITNSINGKTYIGQHEYKNLKDFYMGSGSILKRAKTKYGISKFSKKIICHSIECNKTSNTIEKWLILKEKNNNKAEYNLASGGKYNWKHSEKTKLKFIGNNNALGNILTEETRKQMGESRKGNSNNGVKYLKCVETEEVFRVREWIDKGYNNAHLVAQGNRPHCKKLHFEYVAP